MKAYGQVEAWLHAFLPMQLRAAAAAATYLASVRSHEVARWVPEPVWTLLGTEKSIAHAKNWT
jgi:hypothetical protein